MFDIAFSELVVIGIIALVVLGPQRLAEVARSAGQWVSRIRRFVADVKRDMDVELRKDELAELRKVKEQLTETRHLFEQTASSTLAALPDVNQSILSSPQPDTAAATPGRSSSTEGSSGSRKAAQPAHPRRVRAKKKTTTTKRRKHGRAARKPR